MTGTDYSPRASDAPEQGTTAGAGARGRTLTERRREETRLAIARAAAGLFAERGTERTTAESIAAAAGISIRTFYRYFDSKEEAITPLLTSGADNWVALLADAGAEHPLDAFPRIIAEVLTPADAAGAEELDVTRNVLRAVPETPTLRAAWRRVNFDSEARLRPILAERLGPDADPLAARLLAAAATDAIRVGLEHWAESDADAADPQAGPAAIAERAFARLSHGLREG